MKKSDKIEIKAFNLVYSFLESILARFKDKKIKNPTTYLASELGTSRAYISKVFNAEGNFTVRTLISMANAAGLEIELILKDQKTSEVFNYMQIATVDSFEQNDDVINRPQQTDAFEAEIDLDSKLKVLFSDPYESKFPMSLFYSILARNANNFSRYITPQRDTVFEDLSLDPKLDLTFELFLANNKLNSNKYDRV